MHGNVLGGTHRSQSRKDLIVGPALIAAWATYVWFGPAAKFPRTPTPERGLRFKVSPATAAASCVALACLVLLGLPAGPVVAAFAAPCTAVVVGRLESSQERARRESIQHDLPFALDLMVAALEAGQSNASALALVGGAVGGPIGAELSGIAAKLDLGGETTLVWEAVGADPTLAPLGRAFARSVRSGASATRVLRRAADEARQSRRAQSEERARSVGVKTAAPLGLCFLPAFVLIGVVPMVVSAFRGLVW